jgi:hypothetical protein
VQIVGETLHLRSDDPVPPRSPWFDGTRIALVGARGETLGIQVMHRGGGAVALTVPSAHVVGYDVQRVQVVRSSTDMYGDRMRGTGAFPDELVATDTPATNPAYFTIAVDRDAAPGVYTGELAVAGHELPVELTVAPVTLPPLPIGVWAEASVAELHGDIHAPNAAERACVAMFRERGVLLSPPLPADAYAARKELLAGSPVVPVELPDPPGDAVRAWIAQTRDTGQLPFAIPIDEPKPAARAKVTALARQVRDAGGGPHTFLFAVTDEKRAEYGDLVDLYITQVPELADTFVRWTYNGKPPRAGAMVVDAPPPGPRTWGWIAWRYHIPIWYVWDALYWHDRHNRTSAPPRALDAHADATSFDNGEDHGNLDGVLALPGSDVPCHSTLRLEAIRRGLEDRALLELAATCDAKAAAAIAEQLVPRALGDATDDTPWPADEAPWEAARRSLLALAHCGSGEK